jgi:hypothetical protein
LFGCLFVWLFGCLVVWLLACDYVINLFILLVLLSVSRSFTRAIFHPNCIMCAQISSSLPFIQFDVCFSSKDDLRACEVEAVIVEMRRNGFIVYVPALSLKSSIRCVDSTNHSIAAQALLRPDLVYDASASHVTVTGESAVVKSDSIELVFDGGKTHHCFRLFDHVRVHVQVCESRYRFHSLDFVLVGRWDAQHTQSHTSTHASVDIGQVSTTAQPPMHHLQDSTPTSIRSQYSRHTTAPFYAMFQQFADVALEDE